MRIEKTITVGDLDVVVRELTVGEIRAWLKRLESAEAEFDLVNIALISGVDLADLTAMTDLTAAGMDASTPSQLRTLFDACREVNADFFVLRGSLEAIGRDALTNPAAH